MSVSKNFILQEFVSEELYKRWGDKAVWFLRPEMIQLAQFYRDYFGASVTVNNWHTGGNFNYRGFREPSCTVGASMSQHRFGNGFDCNIKGVSPDEAREEIINNQEAFMAAGLTTLEDGRIAKTWIHSDLRTTNLDHILIVGA